MNVLSEVDGHCDNSVRAEVVVVEKLPWLSFGWITGGEELPLVREHYLVLLLDGTAAVAES